MNELQEFLFERLQLVLKALEKNKLEGESIQQAQNRGARSELIAALNFIQCSEKK